MSRDLQKRRKVLHTNIKKLEKTQHGCYFEIKNSSDIQNKSPLVLFRCARGDLLYLNYRFFVEGRLISVKALELFGKACLFHHSKIFLGWDGVAYCGDVMIDARYASFPAYQIEAALYLG